MKCSRANNSGEGHFCLPCHKSDDDLSFGLVVISCGPLMQCNKDRTDQGGGAVDVSSSSNVLSYLHMFDVFFCCRPRLALELIRNQFALSCR